MYSPPKKQCLTCQFLIEMTRKEGLRLEADLAAHVSKVLYIYYLSQPSVIHIEENHEAAKL